VGWAATFSPSEWAMSQMPFISASVKCCSRPRDALIAATKGGPDLIGLSNETGTLAPGKSADLIAVEGDPLVDPTAVQRVGYVMVKGRPIPMKGQ
jgi:imidazolonepropionase-like amidohydrolase